MRKSLTAVVLVVGMALGSVLTMVLNPVGAASALVSAATSKGSHQSPLQQALDTLVGNGTITQAQANAVTGQVQADRAARAAKHPRLDKRVFQEIAGALHMTPKALRDELASGKSIAQVATEKGVNPTTLGQQIVAGLDKVVNARVASGHLKQQAATIMEQRLPARVDKLLNRTWGKHAHASTSAPTSTAPPTTSAGAGATSSGSTTTSGH